MTSRIPNAARRPKALLPKPSTRSWECPVPGCDVRQVSAHPDQCPTHKKALKEVAR
jgi:hypothetical protein